MAIYQWEATTDREEHEPLIDKNQKERDKMTTYKLFDKNRELKMMEICDTSQSRSHFHNLEIHGKSRTPRKVKMRRVGSVKDLGAED